MNYHVKSYAIVSFIIVLLCTICKGNDSTNSISSVAWNENAKEVWESTWGGQKMCNLLTPRIADIRQVAGKKSVSDKFMKDTVKWLDHVLRKEIIPSNLWKHCIPVDSHILMGTDMSRFALMNERINRCKLDIKSYKKNSGEDTSGILVRYSIKNYTILVIDQAERLCVVVKKQGLNPDTYNIGKKKEVFWTIMKDAFSEQVWKDQNTNALLHIWDEDVESDIYDGYLADYRNKGNEARLNKYFKAARVTLTPGAVIRVVFVKNLPQIEPRARLYLPKSRFEEGTLFNNQNFNDYQAK